MNETADSAIVKKTDSSSTEDDANLLIQLLEWLKEAEGSDSEINYREYAEESYDFYAGKQDTQEVLAALEELDRPASTYNEVKPKVDMLIGLAAQNKKAPSVFPTETSDQAIAELINGAFIFFRKSARIPRNDVECFEHVAKAGRSLLHFYVGGDDPFTPEILTKRIAGRDFWLDPRSVEYDLSDARFLFVDKWFTKGEIRTYFPELNPDEISQLSQTANADAPSFYSTANDLYRVTECWYRKYERVKWIKNPVTGRSEALTEAEFTKFAEQMKQGMDLPNGQKIPPQESVDNIPAFRKSVMYAFFSNNKIIKKGRSPYKHPYFPYVLYGGYKDENENRWFGAIEMMKDPQRGINTMRRQLQHLLQTAPKGILVHATGAIVDIENYEEKSAEPNYHLEINPSHWDKWQFTQQPQISPVYGQLIDTDTQSMKNTSGIQDSLMGQQTSSREPGITVRMRQETGLAVLFLLFDNLRESRLLGGKILLSMIQQYCTTERLIRIEGEEGAKLLQINTQSNKQAPGFNDISVGQYDLTIDEAFDNQTMRMAIMQMLVDFNQQAPGSIPPDLIMEYSDLPLTAKMKVKEYSQMMMQREDQKVQMQIQAEREKTQREDSFKRLELAVEQGIARMEAQVKLLIASKQNKQKSKGE